MLTIVCPNCGPRPVEEFRFGGELPEPPSDLTGEFERDLDILTLLPISIFPEDVKRLITSL